MTFDFVVDQSERYLAAAFDHSPTEIHALLGELSGLMQTDGASSISDFISNAKQEKMRLPDPSHLIRDVAILVTVCGLCLVLVVLILRCRVCCGRCFRRRLRIAGTGPRHHESSSEFQHLRRRGYYSNPKSWPLK